MKGLLALKKKLSAQLIAALFPLIVFPTFFLGLLNLQHASHNQQQQTQQNISNFVEQERQKLASYLQQVEQAMTMLAQLPIVEAVREQFPEDPSYLRHIAMLQSYLDSFVKAYHDSYSLELVNEHGVTLAFSSTDPFAQANGQEILGLMQHKDANKRHLIVAHQNQAMKLYSRWPLYFAKDSERAGQLFGYLVLGQNLSAVLSSIHAYHYPETVNFIVDRSGQVLLSSNLLVQGSQLSAVDLDSVLTASRENRVREHQFDLLKQPTQFLATEFTGGLYFISTVPDSPMLAEQSQIQMTFLVLALLSMVILPSLILFSLRRLILSPIDTFAKASHEVAANNFTVQLPVDRRDEIGQLFADFNNMVHKLLSREQQIHEYRTTLEQKVSSRTAQLAATNQDLQLAIDKAEQANQLKSRFLANMSHEIRTPLTAIIGFTEQVLHSDLNATEQLQLLQLVHKNGKHLLELINNILDISKIEADKLEVESRAESLAAVLSDVQAVCAPQAAAKQLQFQINQVGPLPEQLHTDAMRLKQVLLNLCNNAIKFTEHGHVTVTVRLLQGNRLLQLAVSDSGIGIDNDTLARLFIPFQQADISTTRQYGGSGLGLCIAKNLCQLLGGDLIACSSFGEGSTFTATVSVGQQPLQLVEPLPLTVNAEPVPTTIVKSNSEQPIAHVLVAEDNPDNQKLIKLMLKQLNISAEFVDNGKDAVEKALAEDFDAVLMDMQMPIMGGLEATQMLRYAAYDGPIVALTANVMKEDISTYEAAGCDATVAKPIEPKQLQQTLSSILAARLHQPDNTFEGEAFKQLKHQFLANIQDYYQAISLAYQQQDWTQLAKTSHALKGSAGCFQLKDVQHICHQLELASKHLQFDVIDQQMPKLATAVAHHLPKRQSA